jgi:hypothetical protein
MSNHYRSTSPVDAAIRRSRQPFYTPDPPPYGQGESRPQAETRPYEPRSFEDYGRTGGQRPSGNARHSISYFPPPPVVVAVNNTRDRSSYQQVQPQTQYYQQGNQYFQPPGQYPQGHTAITNDDLSSNGKRIVWNINLRSVRAKLGDEEQGLKSEIADFANGDLTLTTSKPHLRSRKSNGTQAKVLEIIKTRCLPEEDGQETVELTVKDDLDNDEDRSDHDAAREKIEKAENEVAADIRWLHIHSDNSLTMEGFQAAALDAPGLHDEERAIILRTIKKVRQTSEKHFIHGKYLEPIAIRYNGNEKGPSGAEETKFVTFFNCPWFGLRPLLRLQTDKDAPVFPIRTLIQSHYKLESTNRRDRGQIITKLAKDWIRPNLVLCIPQVWVMIISSSKSTYTIYGIYNCLSTKF